MNRHSAEMIARAQRAVKSGKLKRNQVYSVPALAAILGTTRSGLTDATHRDFGSVAAFCTHVGLTAAH
jgi:hypothetical protein